VVVALRADEESDARYAVNTPMKELTNKKWILLKGTQFLLLGLLSSVLLILDHLTVRAALLLVLTVWCFCRFYYFAFYVIEHYVDSTYRFSGLLSPARYLMKIR
jgi:hypothetical protein